MKYLLLIHRDEAATCTAHDKAAASPRPPAVLRSSQASSRAPSVIAMPVNATPVPPPPVVAAGDKGLVAKPPAVATAVVIIARRNKAAMAHVAKAVMATVMGKARVANAVDREVMAARAKVPVTAVAMTTAMTMTAAMPGIGRIMGPGKHQCGRHQDGRGEQPSQHRSSPCPVGVGWHSRCNVAKGKPRNVTPAHEAASSRWLATAGPTPREGGGRRKWRRRDLGHRQCGQLKGSSVAVPSELAQ
jgi:hypothetical protein